MPPTGRIFLSYRRADSRYATLIIYDRLVAHFGDGAAFMDVETIDAGVNFVKVLENAVRSCDVLIAVIGENWLSIRDKEGNRRLDNEKDFVRVEVSTALKREIRVIPVLLDDAPIIRTVDLPDDLKPLAERNAFFVRANAIHADVSRLIPHVERALKAAENTKIQKAATLKAERERALRQNQIAKLHTQADTAISAQDWVLAKKKLQAVLVLNENDLQAQAKLELADEKLTGLAEEQKAQQIAQEEALKEKAAQAQTRAAQERAERLARQRRAAEEKSRQDALKKERRQESMTALKQFLQGKGALIGVGVFLFACLIFGGNYLFSNLFDTPVPTATKYAAPEVPATVVLATDAPTEVVDVLPTAVSEDLGVGSTMLSEKDGMMLVYVPAGEFQMGSEQYDDEKPIHTVYLDAYWIDQTEVTNAMYANFLNEMGNQEEGGVMWLDAGDGDERISQSGDMWQVDSGYENHPAIEVSWYGAQAYCEWAGGSLPAEAQWEKAAGWNNDSQSQQIYPWGSEINDTYANYNQNIGNPTAVGSYESGKSFYGAYDMAGNVWEWVNDWYDAYPGSTVLNSNYGTTYKVMRGGSWYDDVGSLRSAVRYGGNPPYASNDDGFRCVRSP